MLKEVKEVKTTNLLKSASWYRPYNLFNKYEIAKIYFYNSEGIVIKCNAWLESSLISNNNYVISTDIKHEVLENINIIEPIKKLKKDFTCKCNFFIKHEKESWEGYDKNTKYDLYLYIDNINIKVEKLKEFYYTIGDEKDIRISKHFYNLFNISISSVEFQYASFIKVENTTTSIGGEYEAIKNELINNNICKEADSYLLQEIIKRYKLIKR